MIETSRPVPTAADLFNIIEQAELETTVRRDMISAVRCICEMCGTSPAHLKLDVPELRLRLNRIRPAARNVTMKTYANRRSLFNSALAIAGVVESRGRGDAKEHPEWGSLTELIGTDKSLATGLASFMNYCALKGISPRDIDDTVVSRFHRWLIARTLQPKPNDLVRRLWRLWNRAAKEIEAWPQQRLSPISFRARSDTPKLDELHPHLKAEMESYFSARRDPDLFAEDEDAPKRPIKEATIQLQRRHILLAIAVLVRNGWPLEELRSLADLVEPDPFKQVLRHYHEKAEGKSSCFAADIGKTLISVARYWVKPSEERITMLRKALRCMPERELDLTEKNKVVLRALEDERTRARLLFLPETLCKEIRAGRVGGRGPLVLSQIGVVVAILLNAPLRMQNLIQLNWQRHFSEPHGVRGPLRLFIPKQETKTRRRDLSFEISEEDSEIIRWYRREIMPLIVADPYGDLFVTAGGRRKTQETLSQQLTETLVDRVGIHMTPHQFRHFSAMLFLDHFPESFQTVTDLLGHGWSRTTLVYAGMSSRRASRAYSKVLDGQRKALRRQLKRPR